MRDGISLVGKWVSVSLFIAFVTSYLIAVPVSAETLIKEDFLQPQFAKTVDFFECARAWAVLKGLPDPPDHWRANVYTTYINQSSFKLIYAGLRDISLTRNCEAVIPMQTVLMHYKTQKTGQDALVASSFLMIMGFNDTENSLHAGSPDRNDDLWASFSLGLDLTDILPNATLPALNSESEIFDLKGPTFNESEASTTWTWGMRYTNLTAFWIETDIIDADRTETGKPFGLATYDELTFKYTLNLYSNGTAILHKDHIIGRIRDLLVFGGWFLVWPMYSHYNATGCYRYNAKVSDQTVHAFLEEEGVSMSVIEYQKVVMPDEETQTTTDAGYDVSEEEVDISESSISTQTSEGELICIQDFSEKPTYDLYNCSGSDYSTLKAKVRSYNVGGYAKNRELFKFHTSFQRYLPLILVARYPQLYQQARGTLANMTAADYLYVISYPYYGGYKIDHDPVLTAYYEAPQATEALPNLGGVLLPVIIILSLIAAAALIHRRRGA